LAALEIERDGRHVYQAMPGTGNNARFMRTSTRTKRQGKNDIKRKEKGCTGLRISPKEEGKRTTRDCNEIKTREREGNDGGKYQSIDAIDRTVRRLKER